jgi:membrane fusion protein, copper/silver efflux system
MKFINLILLILILGVTACDKNDSGSQQTEGAYYTCPMHPSVKSKAPGACPVCNMSLVMVEHDHQDAADSGRALRIDARKQMLAGIKVDTVRETAITSGRVLTGTVASDEESEQVISSRIAGRIEKLWIRSNGGFVEPGSPLYSIYSEELYADARDFITLVKRLKHSDENDALLKSLLKSSRTKLEWLGLSSAQIHEMESSGKAETSITFYSGQAGTVTEVKVPEGAYVNAGTELFSIASFDEVWVDAQVFADEYSKISKASRFEITSPSLPGKIFMATPIFDSRKVESINRVLLLRLKVKNAHGSLIPGMNVEVRPIIAQNRVKAIPQSALLREQMPVAWIKIGSDRFEQRMITPGKDEGDYVEVLEGLNIGDVVVVSGGYLLSSERILRKGKTTQHNH